MLTLQWKAMQGLGTVRAGFVGQPLSKLKWRVWAVYCKLKSLLYAYLQACSFCCRCGEGLACYKTGHFFQVFQLFGKVLPLLVYLALVL